MVPKIRLILIFFIFTHQITAQIDSLPRKNYSATKAQKSPDIDGLLDDEAWKNLTEAKDFVMYYPGDGDPIPSSHNTSVKVVYDNEALYIAASLLENNPEDIVKQFTQRDNLEQSDYFQIDINTYDDGENQIRFAVTAAGTRADAKITGDNEDFGFNIVWEAAVSQDENGWYAEIRVPYSALRFPEKQEQKWGIQFLRQISQRNESYTWNYVDKAVGLMSQQTGLLTGIENIEPPTRLSFYPYTSAEIDRFDGQTETNFSAGLDVKYGISKAFTLDMTLVPDFGQVAYDNVELNLGPFEQIFGENRAFFTEGTELFTKGDLFYSRRVGNTPIGFNNAQREKLENEEILENPERTDLINALKISGRTERGLGVGFFNAVTAETKAVFRDTLTGKSREKVTEPLANYNILVLDQRFNKNSSISLINTNVTREGSFRDANVTGFLFDVFNKSNSFNFVGEAKMSNVNLSGQKETGFSSLLSVNRTKGNFRYGLSHELANETYDINDLGISFTNNYNNFYLNTSYQTFEPTGIFNQYNIELYANHQRRYRPGINVASGAGLSIFAMTRDRFAFGGFAEVNSAFKDFFEPRRENTFITYQPNIIGNAWISSDYRKKLALDLRSTYQVFGEDSRESFNFIFKPRIRLNERFLVIYGFEYDNEINRPSFVNLQPRDIIFGNRDMQSFENSLQANYNFTTKQALNLSFRHFWSVAQFEEGEFSKLNNDGSLTSVNYDTEENYNPDANFNIWNLDLSYRWQFAPGSEAILLYRNSIFNQDELSYLDFQRSLDNLFDRPARHNFSLRIVYYIDYNQVKNILQS
ncbi:carbohydrate binding family 9 domain-containing protein [Salegentibacter sp. LM13S]|uniref:DUF5916 domain-containing protein n=1 Tax=Salegentibacter lacus TaxID=2873599 RepID=UPI001CC92E52|nr:DUF5916 domain-containing protein [Salegentibacter lacus]MBZ9629834.1 carbohydrate binding family 9 domain-containing protein [Salegentibacter lacus]